MIGVASFVLLLLIVIMLITAVPLSVRVEEQRRTERAELVTEVMLTRECVVNVLFVEPLNRQDLTPEDLHAVCPSLSIDEVLRLQDSANGN